MTAKWSLLLQQIVQKKFISPYVELNILRSMTNAQLEMRGDRLTIYFHSWLLFFVHVAEDLSGAV